MPIVFDSVLPKWNYWAVPQCVYTGKLFCSRSLASQADAFARQTQRLTELITEVQGEEITEETALGIAQRADTGVRSVVARDAVTVFRSRPPRSSGCLPSVCLSIS